MVMKRFSRYRWPSHAVGIRWLFSGWRGFLPLKPVRMAFAGHSAMVDICRDARWGRIAEGSGEDPYLGSLLAKAYVHGYQGDSMQGKDESFLV